MAEASDEQARQALPCVTPPYCYTPRWPALQRQAEAAKERAAEAEQARQALALAGSRRQEELERQLTQAGGSGPEQALMAWQRRQDGSWHSCAV